MFDDIGFIFLRKTIDTRHFHFHGIFKQNGLKSTNFNTSRRFNGWCFIPLSFYVKNSKYTYIYIWIFKYTNSPSHLTLLGLCTGISGEKVATPLFFWSVFKRTLHKSMLFFLVKTHWWAKIGACSKIRIIFVLSRFKVNFEMLNRTF